MTDNAPPRRAGKRADRNPEVDAAFGARIRSARVAAKMSMTTLGEAVGVSYQQMQKYEIGRDRVSAGTLQAIATVLGVHPGSFFDDDAAPSAGAVGPVMRVAPSIDSLGRAREAQRVGARVLQIERPTILRRVLALVDELAKVDGGGLDSADEGEP